MAIRKDLFYHGSGDSTPENWLVYSELDRLGSLVSCISFCNPTISNSLDGELNEALINFALSGDRYMLNLFGRLSDYDSSEDKSDFLWLDAKIIDCHDNSVQEVFSERLKTPEAAVRLNEALEKLVADYKNVIPVAVNEDRTRHSILGTVTGSNGKHYIVPDAIARKINSLASAFVTKGLLKSYGVEPNADNVGSWDELVCACPDIERTDKFSALKAEGASDRDLYKAFLADFNNDMECLANNNEQVLSIVKKVCEGNDIAQWPRSLR